LRVKYCRWRPIYQEGKVVIPLTGLSCDPINWFKEKFEDTKIAQSEAVILNRK